VRILSAILSAQRLREGLKAEVGALYPLLLLRPLEAERPDSPHQAFAALEGINTVCSSPQVLVDIFVNYDCSLQAANLFERTIKALAKTIAYPSTGAAPLPSGDVPKARAAALKALLAAIKSMDTWAGPLKASGTGGVGIDHLSGTGVVSESTRGTADSQSVGAAASDSSSSDQRQPFQLDVLERIHSDKAKKSSLAAGITAFNKDPIKGLRALVDGGVVGPSASEEAAFLRAQSDSLDPAAVGDLLGHHDDHSIAVRIYNIILRLFFVSCFWDVYLGFILVIVDIQMRRHVILIRKTPPPLHPQTKK